MSQQQDQIIADSPQVQNTLSHLDVLQEWVNIHVNILERWESKRYFGYSMMCKSESFANTISRIVTITLQIGGSTNVSLISLSGLQKLDNLMNKVKVRSLEFLNYIFRYLFEKVPNSVKIESPFLQKAV